MEGWRGSCGGEGTHDLEGCGGERSRAVMEYGSGCCKEQNHGWSAGTVVERDLVEGEVGDARVKGNYQSSEGVVRGSYSDRERLIVWWSW